MTWRQPRKQLFLCAGLDAVGCFLGVALAGLIRDTGLYAEPQWTLILVAIYLVLGWLFGSYTVLRAPWLRPGVVCKRVVITCLVTGFVLALVRWLFRIPDEAGFFHRLTVLLLVVFLGIWSIGMRLVLHRLKRQRSQSPYRLLASSWEHRKVIEEWGRHPLIDSPQPYESPEEEGLDAIGVAYGVLASSEQKVILRTLESSNVRLFTLHELAEFQLERLPPSLLPDDWITFGELPWGNDFNFQCQLKRFADVSLSLLLLIMTSPAIALAMLLIWLEDHGPAFFTQERTGLFGHPFRIIKLRTMRSSADCVNASWTSVGDKRITRCGHFLRRIRIDELPQLINVIRGEMSLIGPRPEQPELEGDLEKSIPHYRKRHWVRPGLSGWAQVCAPYAASLDEAEFKLSYDLYYLRHFSTWLDLLILFKTVKTVLKASGR